MKVAVLCEYSGVVRDAFIRRGHQAVSCDLLPTESPGPHIQGDCLAYDWSGFDLLVCHPPCTRLCNSGVQWLSRRGLWKELEEGRRFFLECYELCQQIGRGVCENPIPHKHAKLPPYSQLIQPWMFGHGETKATCLWLVGLPPLMPTHVDAPLFGVEPCEGREGRIHGLGPSKDRSKLRALTYQGVADAMADQWGSIAPPTPSP